MRFTTAWAQIAAQNSTLKLTTIGLTAVSLFLTVATLRLADRQPLIIERGCFATIATKAADTERTKPEIEAFVRQALSERFDTNSSPTRGHLSPEEELSRRQEETELQQSQLSQRIIVNQMSIGKDSVRVEADRLVSVGQVRSALPFPLEVLLTPVARSEANPTGLQLSKVNPAKVPEIEPSKEKSQ